MSTYISRSMFYAEAILCACISVIVLLFRRKFDSLTESFDIVLENVSRKLVFAINRYDAESQYI